MVLQCVAVCRSVLQCVAVCCSVLQCVAVCCSVLQCVAVCCSALQCVAVCCRDVLSNLHSIKTPMQHIARHCNTLQHTNLGPTSMSRCRNSIMPTFTACTTTHCNTLQRTATHCNALQRTATHQLRANINEQLPQLETAPLYCMHYTCRWPARAPPLPRSCCSSCRGRHR